MTCFLLIRHGSVDPLGCWLAGRTAGIHLNQKGREEAEEIANRLENTRVEAIYSSPLERAMETALPLARAKRLISRKMHRLIDTHFGHWTGMSFEELGRLPEWRRFNSQRATARPPGGESMMDVLIRNLAALRNLAEEHEGTVAVFSHCDPIRSVLAHFSVHPWNKIEELVVNPASIYVLNLNLHKSRGLSPVANDQSSFFPEHSGRPT